jgi:tetratricopeptide (TPR) repeat protein
MESNVAQLGIPDRLLAWFELHKKEVLWGSAAIVVAGVGVGFFLWLQGERQASANLALSNVTTSGFSPAEKPPEPEALLKVANQHRNTYAGGRALLLAGASYFAQGKYAEAKTQFERFLRENRESPFADQALLGIAASLDAQGKSLDAIAAYNDIVQHHSMETVAPQAKLALAWLYEKQTRLEQARDLYVELSRGPYGSIATEASVHLESLVAKHPELLPGRRPAGNAPPLAPSVP